MYEIYGKNNCVWCDRAKELLKSREEIYRFYNIEDQPSFMEDFKEIFPFAKTVPQIIKWFDIHNNLGEWISEDYIVIGGYEQLKEHLDGSSPLPTNS